jgi:hypothetical protein
MSARVQLNHRLERASNYSQFDIGDDDSFNSIPMPTITDWDAFKRDVDRHVEAFKQRGTLRLFWSKKQSHLLQNASASSRSMLVVPHCKYRFRLDKALYMLEHKKMLTAKQQLHSECRYTNCMSPCCVSRVSNSGEADMPSSSTGAASSTAADESDPAAVKNRVPVIVDWCGAHSCIAARVLRLSRTNDVNIITEGDRRHLIPTNETKTLKCNFKGYDFTLKRLYFMSRNKLNLKKSHRLVTNCKFENCMNAECQTVAQENKETEQLDVLATSEDPRADKYGKRIDLPSNADLSSFLKGATIVETKMEEIDERIFNFDPDDDLPQGMIGLRIKEIQ